MTTSDAIGGGDGIQAAIEAAQARAASNRLRLKLHQQLQSVVPPRRKPQR